MMGIGKSNYQHDQIAVVASTSMMFASFTKKRARVPEDHLGGR